MTHKEAWEKILPHAVYGGTPEYWAWAKDERVFVQRK